MEPEFSMVPSDRTRGNVVCHISVYIELEPSGLPEVQKSTQTNVVRVTLRKQITKILYYLILAIASHKHYSSG